MLPVMPRRISSSTGTERWWFRAARLGAVWALIAVLGVPQVNTANAAEAMNAADTFDSAALLYQKGQFHEAAAAYERLLTNGVITVPVLLNQANAWLKAGETGRAIARYRQAQSLAPRDRELAANLALARAKVPGAAPAPLTAAGLSLGLGLLSPREWSVLLLGFTWVWGLILVGREVLPRRRSRLSAAAWIVGVFALGTAMLLAVVTLRERQGAVVIIAREAAIRFGPLEESQSAFVLPDGAEAVIVDRKGHWRQVRDRGGRVGWVAGAQVVEVH